MNRGHGSWSVETGNKNRLILQSIDLVLESSHKILDRKILGLKRRLELRAILGLKSDEGFYWLIWVEFRNLSENRVGGPILGWKGFWRRGRGERKRGLLKRGSKGVLTTSPSRIFPFLSQISPNNHLFTQIRLS